MERRRLATNSWISELTFFTLTLNTYDEYIPPQYYAVLLSGAYQGIRAVTNTPVIMGGLASGNLNYLTQVIQVNGKLYQKSVPYN